VLAVATGVASLVKGRKEAAGEWRLKLSWADRASTSVVSLSAVRAADGSLPRLVQEWVDEAVLGVEGTVNFASADAWWGQANPAAPLGLPLQLPLPQQLCPPPPPLPLLLHSPAPI
jgi:hypothetical protein